MTRSDTRLQSKTKRSNWLIWITLAVPVVGAAAGVYWSRPGEAGMVAVLLAIAVVALMAFGFRAAFGNRGNTRATGWQQRAPAVVDRRGQSAPVLSETENDEFNGTSNGRHWSLDVFAAIDAQRFAAVCETWFSWAGFDTRSQSHRTDEGVDIWLHAAKMPGPVAIVRCKHWLDKPVGLTEMKEFLGLVATFKSAHGTYTTTSTYTPEALQFAKENGIDAVDGRGLLRRIQTRTRQCQQALLAVAYNGHS